MQIKTKPVNLQITGNLTLTFENVETGKKRVYKYKNLFTDAGKAAVAARLSGTDTPANTKGVITYCAVGTDATAPAAGDTELGAELARKQIAVRSSSAGVASFRAFFNTGEANGALKEAGLFGDDASGTADSGTLFCHTAIDRTKTSAESLTIDWNVTVSTT